MIMFILIVSIIYIYDVIGLIKERRLRDIGILSLFILLTTTFGIFYLSDPYRESVISKVFSLMQIEY